MLSGIYRIFDRLADFITRLPLIMLVLAALMGYRYYEVQTLFLRVLPADITSRLLAAGLISAVFIFSTIIFMIHAYRIGWGVKLGLVITALVINLYFWEVWQGDWLFKTFISVVIAAFDIGFAYLFHDLRSEQQLQQTVDQLEKQAIKLEQEIESSEAINRRVKAESELLSKVINAHKCPHCQEIFPSPKSVNAHKARCKSNPKTSKPKD